MKIAPKKKITCWVGFLWSRLLWGSGPLLHLCCNAELCRLEHMNKDWALERWLKEENNASASIHWAQGGINTGGVLKSPALLKNKTKQSTQM